MKSFREVATEMMRHRMQLPDKRVSIKVPDAENVLKENLSYFLTEQNRSVQWLPEYSHIADWLTDNKGRGLFLYGSCGRGKSLLCRYVLPAILLTHCRKVVSVFDMQEMNRNIDHVLSKHIISLDDMGTEEVSNIYGNRRLAFAEIIDAAEKHDKLLIVSSNLSADEIRQQYGDRVLDRIKSVTKRIVFEGESLRR